MTISAGIEFTQGEYVDITLFLTDNAGEILDITGCTFEAEIRDVNDLDTLLAAFTCTPDIATGSVLLELQSSVSKTLPATVQFTQKGTESPTPAYVLFYDCFKVISSSRKAIASGPVKIRPAMTRI